ncbi:MAG: TetR/AcrR family transcriptional regulator [Lachnospiraceae bacterium]|nr:TetR/AcrR family transcriptional regulator [Lachnospiraceae bacterium]
MDTRIVKTKTKLMQALSELTQDRSMDEISVSELCKKAGVNRTTFYKYYQVPSDVGRESFERHMEELMEKMHRTSIGGLYDTLLFCCREYQRNYLITKQVFPGFSVSAKMIQDLYLSLWQPEQIRDIDKLYYIAGGTAMVIQQWLESETEKKPETVARKLARFIRPILKA